MLELGRSPENRGDSVPETLEDYIAGNPFLKKAHDFAEKAHEGATRAEGVAYFTHCLAVVRILYEEWGVRDDAMLAAGFLHDTVEDIKEITNDDVKREFDEDVAFLVDGVSKFRSDDKENIRKVFDKNFIDPRVGVLKLADRLHNMRTLKFVPGEKQIPKARETEGYASFAESLGMWKVKSQLEDLALKYTSPEEYENLARQLSADPRLTNLRKDHYVSTLEALAKRVGVDARVERRINSLARLKHKMDKGAEFPDINDVVSYRVTTEDDGDGDRGRNDCYKMLGAVKEKFADMEDRERFDDFFATPQTNGYSTIQVTLKTDDGAVEIAIATKTKEDFNNWGVVSLMRKGVKNLSAYILKLVFTPSNQVKFFHPYANGIDFIYSIDNGVDKEVTMIDRATGILVDGARCGISTVIPNGATVEIGLGKAKPAPLEQYLNLCLPKTRKIIERHIAKRMQREYIKKGREIADQTAGIRSLTSLSQLLDRDESAQKLVDWLYDIGCKGHLNELYNKIGRGKLTSEFLDKELENLLNNS